MMNINMLRKVLETNNGLFNAEKLLEGNNAETSAVLNSGILTHLGGSYSYKVSLMTKEAFILRFINMSKNCRNEVNLKCDLSKHSKTHKTAVRNE